MLQGMSFFLPLGDSGSGAVNTTPVSTAGSPTATFTRATTATTIDSTGLVVSVGSGVARSYYDPTTLSYLGYLAEGARTNLCLQSEDLATTWTVVNASVSTNVATAPDGNTTADKVIEDSTTNTHVAQIVSQSFTANSTLTVSAWVKNAGRGFVFINIFNTADGFGSYFDLTGATGNTANTGAGVLSSKSITAYPNGWYRCTITGVINAAATTCTIQVFPASANGTINYLGNGSSGIFAWGAQLEEASFASSYIPTTAASVTRNADVLTYASSGNVSGTAGSCYAEVAISNGISLLSPGRFVTFSNSAERDAIYCNNAAGTLGAFDGTNVATLSNVIFSDGVLRKYGSSWGSALRVFSLGLSGTSQSFDGNMDVGTLINIGFLGSIPGYELYGTVRNVRIWTIQLTDAQLQGITS